MFNAVTGLSLPFENPGQFGLDLLFLN